MLISFGAGFAGAAGRGAIFTFGGGGGPSTGLVLRAQWTGSQIGELSVRQDFEAQADVEQRAAATGEWEDAAGIVTLEWRIAATPDGPVIAGLSTQPALERSSTAARYYAAFDTADLVAGLNNATYLNKKVYLVLSKTGDLDGLWWSFWVRGNREGF